MSYYKPKNDATDKGGQKDFESLLSPHLDYLYRIAYRFTANRADAEDLVQDLMLKLYPRREELVQVSNLRSWLVRVLYRMFIDQKRKQRISPLHLLKSDQNREEDNPLDQISGSEPDPEDILEQQNLSEKIEQALNRLGKEQRAIITLHDIEGYRLTELESMLEVPLGTLKSRLQRSRKKLKTILQIDGTF